MKHSIIVISTLALLAGGTASAGTGSSKEENIGVGFGVTVGAVAGGPVGAILGAAIGAKFGDSFHHRKQQVATLEASLTDTQVVNERLQQRVSTLETTVADRDGDIARLKSMSRPELLSLLKAGIEMDLLFRTDERELTSDTNARVTELASMLAQMPDVRIQLDGYADERGDAGYNDKLSADRAVYVRDLLRNSGINAARITLSAHGESPAAERTTDSYALERKVSMTLFVDDTPAFAANPE